MGLFLAAIALSLPTHCPCRGHWVGNDRTIQAQANLNGQSYSISLEISVSRYHLLIYHFMLLCFGSIWQSLKKSLVLNGDFKIMACIR